MLARLERFRQEDMPWRDGRTWAYVYDPGHEAEAVIKEAFASYLTENALDPTVFPSALRMENEVVAMAASHLAGDAGVVGNFTSGGTESIILAVKAARDFARAQRPGIVAPEMVLPETAHASFQKAGHYLGVQPVLVPVDPTGYSRSRAILGPKIRAAFGQLRPEELDEETFRGLLAMAGTPGGGLPRRMAEINEVLNALPVELRERLLVEYLNGLFTQPGDA